jgi:hypothetical protein
MSAVVEKLTIDIYRPLPVDDLEHSIDPFYVDRLEGLVGCKLPADYVEFLMTFPRSGFCHDYKSDRPAGISGIESAISAPSSVYAIGVIFAQSEVDSCDLIWNTENSNESKSDVVWIADTGGSQVFGMMLTEKDFGRIYYFDWDIEKGEEPLVAESFSDFIDRLIIL